MNQQLPTIRSWAALTFLGYGLVVMIGATLGQTYSDWAAASEYWRAIIRAAGVSIVAWGLWQHARWARWLALALTLLWGISGAMALIAIFHLQTSPAAVQLPPGFYATSIVAFVLLLATLVLLLMEAAKRQHR